MERLLRLLQLADSALPVGAAAHSFGLESLIQEGLLGADELESFLRGYLEESFRIFQGRILEEYEAMAAEMGFDVIDATKSIERQQKEMRRIFLDELGAALPNGVLEAHKVQTHA